MRQLNLSAGQDWLSATFIGGGYGEAILLNVGGGLLCVIDCCRALVERDRKFVTSAFLPRALSMYPDAKIGFVLLTHPHLDHFQSLPALLRAHCSRIRRVVLFQGVTEAELLDVLRDEAGSCICGASANASFEHYRDILDIWRSETPEESKLRASEGTTVYEASVRIRGRRRAIPFSVRAFAPSAGDTDTFLTQVRSLRNLREGKGRHDQVCNLVSVALLVEFGEARLFLGGDLQSDSWRRMLKRYPPGAFACTILKVSHHGSREGNDFRLVELRNPKAAESRAIVTPFSRERLPDQAVLNRIAAEFGPVVCSASEKLPHAAAERRIATELPFVTGRRLLPRYARCSWTATLCSDGSLIGHGWE